MSDPRHICRLIRALEICSARSSISRREASAHLQTAPPSSPQRLCAAKIADAPRDYPIPSPSDLASNVITRVSAASLRLAPRRGPARLNHASGFLRSEIQPPMIGASGAGSTARSSGPTRQERRGNSSVARIDILRNWPRARGRPVQLGRGQSGLSPRDFRRPGYRQGIWLCPGVGSRLAGGE